MPGSLRFTFWIATLATVVNSVAYVLTFADWALFQILGFLPVLFIVWPLALWHWRRVPRRNLVSEIFGDIPRWLKAAAAALLLFAFANFVACRALNDFARPQRLDDGRAALVAGGGRVVRELTPAQYRHAEAVQVRMLAGALAACFGLAALLAEACWIKNGPAMADRRL